MSPEILRDIQLPPGAPATLRLRLYVMRFLAHHNRLDGYMAFVAVYWGAWTLLFPRFWGDWPVTAELSKWTGGQPSVVSWTLLLAGLGSYLARRRNWHALRAVCALLAFSNWAMLSLIFLSVDPIFSPGAACYSAFAIAKLISYVNFVIRVDQERDDLESAREGA